MVSALDSGASGPGSSPDQGHVLCSWARHFTLTVPLSTQVYEWVPANLMLGGQGSKLTLANSQNASAFDNLRVRKIATSKRLRVRIIHVYQTFGKNL